MEHRTTIRRILKLWNCVASIVLGSWLTATSLHAAEASQMASKTPTERTHRHYEVIWAADKSLCEKVAAYAERVRPDFLPSDVDFGNLRWTILDDPGRQALNVTFAGESDKKTLFRWVNPNSAGKEWSFALTVFPETIDFDILKKEPVFHGLEEETYFEPETISLIGIANKESIRPSPWCERLKDLACNGVHAQSRFSFFDVLEIDQKVYLVAHTEKYANLYEALPHIVFVGKYRATKPTPPKLKGPLYAPLRNLEHLCYLANL